VQSDLPAVLSRPAFDKLIRNQAVHQPDGSGMRQAKNPPQRVVGHALAISDDDEGCRRLAATAYDLARSLLDTIHDGERKRSQQIRDSSFHAMNNMCAAHKKQLDRIYVLRTYSPKKSDDDMENGDEYPERCLNNAECHRP
jgi:hypothetical protein